MCLGAEYNDELPLLNHGRIVTGYLVASYLRKIEQDPRVPGWLANLAFAVLSIVSATGVYIYGTH